MTFKRAKIILTTGGGEFFSNTSGTELFATVNQPNRERGRLIHINIFTMRTSQ